MKKIIFVMPLMAISLFTNCSNNSDLSSYYTRRDYYMGGVHDSYELYEYNDKHLVSKATNYHYSRNNPQMFDEIAETTYTYDTNDQLTKKVVNKNTDEELKGEMKLFRTATEEHKYDANHNEIEKKSTTVTYLPDLDTYVQTSFIEIEYDDHKNITKKISKNYVKINDQPEELDSVLQYTASYDSNNRILNEIAWNSIIDGTAYTLYKENEKTMTYDKYQDFKTMEEIEYSNEGQSVHHASKYENQFDDKGRISSQRITDITPPQPESENEDVDEYIDIEYTYDSNDNLIRRLGRSYKVTESGTTIELAMEEEHAYLNNNPDKPIYSIVSGHNKYFGSITKINKYEYDQHGRITFSEYVKLDGSTKKPAQHDIYTYEYN